MAREKPARVIDTEGRSRQKEALSFGDDLALRGGDVFLGRTREPFVDRDDGTDGRRRRRARDDANVKRRIVRHVDGEALVTDVEACAAEAKETLSPAETIIAERRGGGRAGHAPIEQHATRRAIECEGERGRRIPEPDDCGGSDNALVANRCVAPTLRMCDVP